MKATIYNIEVWNGLGYASTWMDFTSKAEAIKAAVGLPEHNKTRIRRRVTSAEIVWRSKTLRGDTRARKAQ